MCCDGGFAALTACGIKPTFKAELSEATSGDIPAVRCSKPAPRVTGKARRGSLGNLRGREKKSSKANRLIRPRLISGATGRR